MLGIQVAMHHSMLLHCSDAFASAYLFFSCLQLHPIQCVLLVISFSRLSFSLFHLIFVFEKAIKAALHCLDACVGVCVKPKHSYIFMIILICVASKFSHKASIWRCRLVHLAAQHNASVFIVAYAIQRAHTISLWMEIKCVNDNDKG